MDAANSLVASLSVIAASVVVTPAMSQQAVDVRTNQPAVTFTAATQPLPAAVVEPRAVQPTALPAIQQFDPLAQQVEFHVAFVTDFLTTGAVLFAREFAIPQTLAQDVGNGTQVPVALNRALLAFIQVELDAGRELVNFAAQYVDFQLRFVANVLQEAVDVATAVPVAVGEPVASTVGELTPKAEVTTTARAGDVAKADPSVDVSAKISDEPDGDNSRAKDGTTTSSKPKKADLADEAAIVRTQGDNDNEGLKKTTGVSDTKSTNFDAHGATTTSATSSATSVTSATDDSRQTASASADDAKPKYGNRHADATSGSGSGSDH
jgi:hypothetical protein